MHRLLIVDDEQHVVTWLSGLFASLPDAEFDVYAACSAEEALAVLAATSIEVVLCDYRMPGMNGLELLDRIRATWADRRVVFLSGYNEFEYIYRAGAHGAVRYVLKTEDDDVIVGAVRDAVRAIERERAEAAIIDTSRFAVGLLEHLDRSEALRRSIDAEEQAPGAPFDLRLPVLPVLGQVMPVGDEFKEPEAIRTRYSLEILTGRIFGRFGPTAVLEAHGNTALWILQGTAPTAREASPLPPAAFLCQRFEALQSLAARSLGVRVGFVLHDVPVPWSEVKRVLHALERRVPRRQGSRDGVEAISFAPSRGPSESPSEQLLATRVRQFVEANLGGDLSLTGISRHVFYNPAYISRVFKKVTRTNLNDFISEKRIERAAALLARGEGSISDIARECGFLSPQYFSTAFRRAKGCAPLEYRARESGRGNERK